MAIIQRECLSVGADSEERPSVLVVSTDEDRESFRSELFVYGDFLVDAEVSFDEDLWISSMWKAPNGLHFMCEILGNIYWETPNGFESKTLTDERLFKIWGIHESSVWVVGESGSAFHFDGKDWSDVSQGLEGYLHAIGGVTEDRIYAAGDNGFLAHWNGGTWDRIELPTNADWRGLLVVGNGLYLAGLGGAVGMLLDGEFTFLDESDVSFFSVTEYANKVLFGSLSDGIFLLDEGSLVPFKPNALGYSMKSTQRYLWTCGLSQIARFDGENWVAKTFS